MSVAKRFEPLPPGRAKDQVMGPLLVLREWRPDPTAVEPDRCG